MTQCQGPALRHRRSQGGPRELGPPPIEMTPMIKCDKKSMFLSFFYHLSIQQYTCTTVINNKLTTRSSGPPIQFGQPIYMYNLGEIMGFCPKSCNARPSSNLFYERNAITRVGFTICHSARCPAPRR